MSSPKILLLIDGNNLFHRAYHALPALTDKTGENANAVFGFSNMLIRAVKEVEPTYIACAFDTKAPTFRHVEFEAYKAQRKAPPEDLYPQLPKVKAVLDAFGVKYFEKAGYEADDILATVASRAVNSSQLIVHGKKNEKTVNPSGIGVNREPSTVDQVVILSGDRDLLQLVDGNIKVQAPGWNLSSTTLYGSKEVEEKFGITPLQMVDYKAMIGDPSDNIPGIAGIGPKTASALLQKYKTLEGIYDNIDEISGTTKDKLEKDKEIALAAKKLVKLDCNVDISFKLSELRFNPDWEKVIKEFEGLGFKSIVAKLQGKAVGNAKSVHVADNNKDQLELI
ncbi:MAG: 5'-3' exonuclease H3TH domain-containing protein [Patescibacteria group bacterium]